MSSVAEKRKCECGAEIPEVRVMGIVLPLSRCPDCSARIIAEEKAEKRIRVTQKALDRAGATPRQLAQTLDATADDLSEQLAQVREWLDGFRDGARQNLWLAGEVGTGKTWIAWGIVRELVLEAVDRRYDESVEERDVGPWPPAMFVNWRDLLNDLRDEYREGQGAASGLYKRGCHVTVLALDDLGAERPTPWALEALAGLVQSRYDHCLPTIVTSNFSTAELTERLSADEVVGRRIVNRLIEGGVGIRFDGASRRRAG